MCRVEIIEARRDKGIGHATEFRMIDLLAVHRKPHAAEAEISANLREKLILFHSSVSFLCRLFRSRNHCSALAMSVGVVSF